jgi:GNAT superfamily N-acetyltransferase
MTVQEVTEKNEVEALSYLYKDLFLNTYAINRLQNRVRGSSLYLSLDKKGSISGYLSVLQWVSQATDVCVRAKSVEVLNELLDFFTAKIWKDEKQKKLWVLADPEFISIIKEKFPLGSISFNNVMIVRRGEEKLPEAQAHTVVRLSPSNVQEYAEFVVPHNFVITEDVVQRNREFLEKSLVYAIFEGAESRKLVSTGNAAAALSDVTLVSGVETHVQYRRKGFATAIVSALVREGLKNSKAVLLYVDRENHDAIGIYERLGFRKIAEALLLEAN